MSHEQTPRPSTATWASHLLPRHSCLGALAPAVLWLECASPSTACLGPSSPPDSCPNVPFLVMPHSFWPYNLPRPAFPPQYFLPRDIPYVLRIYYVSPTPAWNISPTTPGSLSALFAAAFPALGQTLALSRCAVSICGMNE